MSIKVGDQLPDVQVYDGGPGNKTSVRDVFGNKKGVLFGVPGAFTPGCSKTHLPGYVNQAEDLKSRGVEILACISVNDAFVVSEWGKVHGAEGKIHMLADPTGAFAKAAGLLLDKKELEDLFGNKRCKSSASSILSVVNKLCDSVLKRVEEEGELGNSPNPIAGHPGFSLIVEDGKVKAINIEEDGTGLTCSLAGNITSQL